MSKLRVEVAEMLSDRDIVTDMDLYKCKQLIRELNAKELKKAWREHLKRQVKKNAEQKQ